MVELSPWPKHISAAVLIYPFKELKLIVMSILNTEYKGVAWSAQQMPVDFFNTRCGWSISFGRTVSQNTDVILTRKNDGKVWNFSNSQSDGQFLVENSYYGQKGCVIFQHDNIKSYKNGDVFNVYIEENGTVIADYDVNFFNLNKSSDNVGSPMTRITKLTGANKSLKVSWKKPSEKVAGYQIRYSRSSKMTNAKTVTVAGYNTTSKTIKKLSAKKKYYVKVRTYKTVQGTRHYSEWSKVKPCMT